MIGGQIAAASALALELSIEIYEDARLERDEDPPTGLSLWKGERTPGIVARTSRPSAPVLSPKDTSSTREMVPVIARELSPRPEAKAAPRPEPTVQSVRAEPRPMDTAPAAALGWAQVAAVSEQAEKVRAAEPQRATRASSGDDDEDAAAMLGKGDWVEHRQFGLCRIDGEDPEGALILRLPSGMRKHIKLDFMEVLPPRQDGERRIFPLRPRRK